MLYRLLINYFRLKVMRMVLLRVVGSKFVQSKNLKSISILTYILEMLAVAKMAKKK